MAVTRSMTRPNRNPRPAAQATTPRIRKPKKGGGKEWAAILEVNRKAKDEEQSKAKAKAKAAEIDKQTHPRVVSTGKRASKTITPSQFFSKAKRGRGRPFGSKTRVKATASSSTFEKRDHPMSYQMPFLTPAPAPPAQGEDGNNSPPPQPRSSPIWPARFTSLCPIDLSSRLEKFTIPSFTKFYTGTGDSSASIFQFSCGCDKEVYHSAFEQLQLNPLAESSIAHLRNGIQAPSPDFELDLLQNDYLDSLDPPPAFRVVVEDHPGPGFMTIMEEGNNEEDIQMILNIEEGAVFSSILKSAIEVSNANFNTENGYFNNPPENALTTNDGGPQGQFGSNPPEPNIEAKGIHRTGLEETIGGNGPLYEQKSTPPQLSGKCQRDLHTSGFESTRTNSEGYATDFEASSDSDSDGKTCQRSCSHYPRAQAIFDSTKDIENNLKHWKKSSANSSKALKELILAVHKDLDGEVIQQNYREAFKRRLKKVKREVMVE